MYFRFDNTGQLVTMLYNGQFYIVNVSFSDSPVYDVFITAQEICQSLVRVRDSSLKDNCGYAGLVLSLWCWSCFDSLSRDLEFTRKYILTNVINELYLIDWHTSTNTKHQCSHLPELSHQTKQMTAFLILENYFLYNSFTKIVFHKSFTSWDNFQIHVVGLDSSIHL